MGSALPLETVHAVKQNARLLGTEQVNMKEDDTIVRNKGIYLGGDSHSFWFLLLGIFISNPVVIQNRMHVSLEQELELRTSPFRGMKSPLGY